MTLDKMKTRQCGVVIGHIDSPIARRLIEMGLALGVEFEFLRKAPLRDPIEIKIGHSFLAIRKKEASLVVVEVI